MASNEKKCVGKIVKEKETATKPNCFLRCVCVCLANFCAFKKKNEKNVIPKTKSFSWILCNWSNFLECFIHAWHDWEGADIQDDQLTVTSKVYVSILIIKK